MVPVQRGGCRSAYTGEGTPVAGFQVGVWISCVPARREDCWCPDDHQQAQSIQQTLRGLQEVGESLVAPDPRPDCLNGSRGPRKVTGAYVRSLVPVLP
jgi:hypothetical protein